MKRMVIKGSEWGRGKSGGLLLDPSSGRRCCIGIHAKMCGVADKLIARRGAPEHVWYDIGDPEASDLSDWGDLWLEERGFNNVTCEDAIALNDDCAMSDDERIEKLRPLFREIGVIIVWRPDL